jgi:hypothetical protein
MQICESDLDLLPVTQASADSISTINVASAKGFKSTSSSATPHPPSDMPGCTHSPGNPQELLQTPETASSTKLLIVLSLIFVLLHLIVSESAWGETEQEKSHRSNEIETLTLDLTEIENISLLSNAQISIDDCNDFSDNTLQISANADTIRRVHVDQKKGRLTVNLSGPLKEPIKVHLHKKKLQQFVFSTDAVSEPRLDVDLEGSRVRVDEMIVSRLFVRLSAQSHFDIGLLVADRLDIHGSDESLLRIRQVQVDQLSVTARHAAAIELAGKAFSQSAMTSNNSRYDARAMQSQLAEVFMRDNSAVLMHVERQVSFDTNHPSALHLEGGAKIIN